MKNKKRKSRIFTVTLALLILFGVYTYCQNNFPETTRYDIRAVKIPEAFDGFVIAQISDFHNTDSQKLQEDILKELKAIKPDIIVITGDYIDTRRTDTALALSYAERLLQLAPVYFSAGNHEAATVYEYPSFEKALRSLGVTVLRNECTQIEKNGQLINLLGIDDPLFIADDEADKFEKTDKVIKKINYDKDIFGVTLSHRPEIFSVYVENEQDLVLSGHAHGGQFRLPVLGGLYTPTEGLFPEYTEGIHEENNTKMIVSRGIGASVFPFRINNRPELVIVTLHTEAH